MNKYYLTFFLILLLQMSVCFGQDAKPDIMLGVGSSINILHQQNHNDWKSLSYGFNFGLFTSRTLSNKSTLLFGITYQYIWTDNYNNTVNYTSNWTGGPEQSDVNLKTSLRLQYIELPFIYKRYIKNKFSIGGGLKFSYLMFAKFSQEAVGNYSNSKYPSSDAAFDASVKFVFGVKDYVTTSPFSKTNIAPVFNVGYSFSRRLNIEYFLSYDLISNPQMDYKFNEYNPLSNNFILTFKLN